MFRMLCSSRFQSSYRLALRPLGRHISTITTSNQNISMMAHKRENGGVQSETPKDKQGSNKSMPKIEDKLETRPWPESYKELQRLDDWWLKHSQEQEQELQRKSAEIQRKSTEIQNLKSTLMREKAERGRVERLIRIHGAIEKIITHAKLENLAEWVANHEVATIQLTSNPQFTKVLHEEVQARRLVLEDVATCVHEIYFRLLSPWRCRDKTVVISETDFTAEEYAALITFMKVQSKWQYPLSWREDVSGEACEEDTEGRQQVSCVPRPVTAISPHYSLIDQSHGD
ncbi:hypothetical protein B9Z19DRAFT_1060494 [Tuber borchii]|uniref:Uncharacterized protein n=1 Tax=Tuber borchii TaxID=42251 RepID=A0A2T7A8N3_TUBBO|nr:hypothetical protein B9Z19DRAFT_1060494 [Tuber borchii]